MINVSRIVYGPPTVKLFHSAGSNSKSNPDRIPSPLATLKATRIMNERSRDREIRSQDMAQNLEILKLVFNTQNSLIFRISSLRGLDVEQIPQFIFHFLLETNNFLQLVRPEGFARSTFISHDSLDPKTIELYVTHRVVNKLLKCFKYNDQSFINHLNILCILKYEFPELFISTVDKPKPEKGEAKNIKLVLESFLFSGDDLGADLRKLLATYILNEHIYTQINDASFGRIAEKLTLEEKPEKMTPNNFDRLDTLIVRSDNER